MWVTLILAGTYQLLKYEYTPGNYSTAPNSWLSNPEVKLSTTGYTLLMAVHPKCGCSQASLGELSKLSARFPQILQAKIIFITPKNAQESWMQSENWSAAKAIVGAEVIHDSGGKLAKLFNLQTSGSTLLYNSAGKLLFSGGITSSRGHWGDNAGSQAISDLITKGNSEKKLTAAFGCNLFNKKER